MAVGPRAPGFNRGDLRPILRASRAHPASRLQPAHLSFASGKAARWTEIEGLSTGCTLDGNRALTLNERWGILTRPALCGSSVHVSIAAFTDASDLDRLADAVTTLAAGE